MKRTGNNRIAVVGWGRGMGHTGHMYLADAVITQAKEMGADPYFFVSKTIGKDDPIYPEEKIKIYQKVFPQYAKIFTPEGNLNQALTDLSQLGYTGVVVVVGADQKNAFKYLENPNKEGVPVYQTMGFKKLRVISRQETRSKYAKEEGPRATPMREVLMNPDATEETKFAVWRRDMPQALSDEEVLDLMHKAEQRMRAIPTKAKKLKEFITKVRPMLKEASVAQKLKVLKFIKESLVNEFAPGNGDDGLPYAEYVVYQCDPKDQFEFIGGPLYQTDNLGMAHKYAYEHYLRYRPKAFVVYQPHKAASRGNYGVKGESDEDVAEGFGDVVKGIKRKVAGKADPKEVEHMYGRIARSAIKHKTPDQAEKDIERYKKVAKVVNKEDPLNEFAVDGFNDGDNRSKLLGTVASLFKAGNKIDWKVPGQMGHVLQVKPDGVTMKKWGSPYSKIRYFLPIYDDSRDNKYTIKMIGPKHYAVVSSDPNWQLEEEKSKAIAQTAKDLKNPPKVMQHRAKRDMEREVQLRGRDIAKRDDDDFFPVDNETQQLMSYVRQHYPNATTKQQAFIKFVQRSLKHSKEEDETQDKEIDNLKKEIGAIKQSLPNVTESTDYLDEK